MRNVPTSGLRAESISYRYGQTQALHNVSLGIEPGEIVAITGPSGCGKSTLLLNLAGVLRPDSGNVTFDAKPVSSASEPERSRMRRTIFGVLFQFGQLVPELTAAENVALPLMLAGSKRSEARGRTEKWLEWFGISDVANVGPAEMSGGQMQRVALARAMVTEPQVLFADEPTGALDALSSDQVMTALVRVARETTTTLLIVTHDAKVAAFGDSEILMRDGMIEQALPLASQ